MPDRKTGTLHCIALEVKQVNFHCLLRDWKKAKFLAVYDLPEGPHCVYVEGIVNGELCCINSHGKIDQFPHLRPGMNYANITIQFYLLYLENVSEVYRVKASVTMAPTERTSVSQTNALLGPLMERLEEELADLLIESEDSQIAPKVYKLNLKLIKVKKSVKDLGKIRKELKIYKDQAFFNKCQFEKDKCTWNLFHNAVIELHNIKQELEAMQKALEDAKMLSEMDEMNCNLKEAHNSVTDLSTFGKEV